MSIAHRFPLQVNSRSWIMKRDSTPRNWAMGDLRLSLQPRSIMIRDIIKYAVWMIFVLTVLALCVTFLALSARPSEAVKKRGHIHEAHVDDHWRRCRSFKWYQLLLGLPATPPAHDYFGQIVDRDGTVLLCLHGWGAHEHPSLTSPEAATPGNGLLLFFRWMTSMRPCRGRARSRAAWTKSLI
jgi:hypothetical protein